MLVTLRCGKGGWFRKLFALIVFFFILNKLHAQCPYYVDRNNGNNANCWLDQSGEYGTKEGALTLYFTSTQYPTAPYISLVWLNSAVAPVYVGAPSPPNISLNFLGLYWYSVTYCYYNGNIQPAGSSTYTLELTSQNGTVISKCTFDNTGFGATTPVLATPLSIQALTDAIACQNGSTTFTVYPSNGTVTAYQWEVSTDGGVNYTPINNTSANPSGITYSGTTTATLTAIISSSAAVNPTNAPLYRCVLTSGGIKYYSGAGKLTVKAAPPMPVIVSGP